MKFASYFFNQLLLFESSGSVDNSQITVHSKDLLPFFYIYQNFLYTINTLSSHICKLVQ